MQTAMLLHRLKEPFAGKQVYLTNSLSCKIAQQLGSMADAAQLRGQSSKLTRPDAHSAAHLSCSTVVPQYACIDRFENQHDKHNQQQSSSPGTPRRLRRLLRRCPPHCCWPPRHLPLPPRCCCRAALPGRARAPTARAHHPPPRSPLPPPTLAQLTAFLHC